LVIKKLLKKIFGRKTGSTAQVSTLPSAHIIPRSEHPISRKNINPHAVNVLYRLQEAGFDAYLVGGGVRDLLLGLHPKDFDVATNAHPEQVRRLFRNSRLIGRRFKLVHVFFGREIIEVSTFRKGADPGSEDHAQTEHGLVVRDNVYGTLEEDALRRDFTVNALYYNIANFSLIDFTQGLADLGQRVLRVIGEPDQRFREDPVRMIRAVRLAGKLGLSLDPAIETSILKNRHLLSVISPARLFDELVKIILSKHVTQVFALMQQHQLLEFLMPEVAQMLSLDEPQHQALFDLALHNTDQRLAEHKTINPAFMLAVWYWPVVSQYFEQYKQQLLPLIPAFDKAMSKTLQVATQHLHIPKRLTANMRDIWHLQQRFSARPSKYFWGVLEHPKFRAGFDFLLLRAMADTNLQPLAEWWQSFYDGDSEQREALLALAERDAPKKRRRRKKTRKAPTT
jgi:poly(A) polymerase